MANRERGEMTLVAGSQTYVLRLTTNACCELEDKSGKLFDDILRNINKGSVRDLRWLLWACLQDQHADTVTDVEVVGRIIDDAGGLMGAMHQIRAFMTMNMEEREELMPPPKAGVARPLEAQPAPNGVDSTLTPVGSSA